MLCVGYISLRINQFLYLHSITSAKQLTWLIKLCYKDSTFNIICALCASDIDLCDP